MYVFATFFGLFMYLVICDAKASQECKINEVSLTNFGPVYCNRTKGEYYYKNVDGCVPGCVFHYGLCERPTEKNCAPGLKFDDENMICIIDEDSCFKYEHLINSEHVLVKPKWIPTCSPDGSYAPKQCKGEMQNGRCFCYDPKGNRIFGDEWWNQAENMTCACSRHRWELENAGRDDVKLHCDSMGNYEPLQCESGLCWCAEPKTGEILESVVPEAMMYLLPCYKREKVGNQYLRQCESEAIAQTIIKKEFFTHGTTYVRLPFILCDWDGSYGRYTYEGANAYCVWRDNTHIGIYQALQQQSRFMNCNCAWDKKLYEISSKEFMKDCKDNGNYKEIQQYNDTFYYCVDSDGFSLTDPEENIDINDCVKLKFEAECDLDY